MEFFIGAYLKRLLRGFMREMRGTLPELALWKSYSSPSQPEEASSSISYSKFYYGSSSAHSFSEAWELDGSDAFAASLASS